MTAGAGAEDKRVRTNLQPTTNGSEFYLFFAIETSGGLGREACEFVKLFAKMSGGKMSSTISILRIYQTLAMEFQTT
jgi:hypothetical protein